MLQFKGFGCKIIQYKTKFSTYVQHSWETKRREYDNKYLVCCHTRNVKKKIMYCFVESAIYSILIYIVFFTLNNARYDFLTMNLHPLAIMVAYLALKYGIYVGFVGSITAIITYMIAYLSLGNDFFLFFLKFYHYKFFLMFLFINVLLGKFKTNYDEREEKIIEDKKELEEKYLKLDKERTKLIILNDKLKNQITTSSESLISLYHIIHSLREKNLEELYTEIMLLLKHYLKCETASMYMFIDDNTIKKIVYYGKSTTKKIIDLNSEQGLRFEEARKNRKITEFPVDLDGKEPIYVMPLYMENKIGGFLNIEKLHYDIKDRYSVELFKIIGEMIKDIFYDGIEKKINDKFHMRNNNSLVKWEYFEHIVEENDKRKKLFEYDYALLEGKNLGYTLDDFVKFFEEEKVNEDGYITFNDKYIKVIEILNYGESKGKLLERLNSYFKEVAFYEI